MEKGDFQDEYIEFDRIRELIDLKSPELFKYYAQEVYKDLSERKESSKTQGVVKVNFFEFIKNIHYFFADKLFEAMDLDKDGFLNLKELKEGLFELYLGTFEDALRLIFRMIDFNQDGKIEKEDMQIMLSYLPIREENDHMTNIKYQLKSKEEINIIINNTFYESNSLDFESYTRVVEERDSDSFLQILCYFYQNKPFSSSNFDIYMNQVKKKLVQAEEYSPSLGKKILSPKKSTYLSPTKLITASYEDLEKNLDGFSLEAVGEKHDEFKIKLPHIPKKVQENFEPTDSPVMQMKRYNKPDKTESLLDSPTLFLRKLNKEDGSPVGKLRTLKKSTVQDKVTYEGWISKITENNRVKRFWLVLIGNDIYYYKTDSKKDYQGMHNLSGCFFKEIGEKVVGDQTFFSFAIEFSNRKRKYFCETKEDMEVWRDYIKESLGYLNIKDNYDMGKDLESGKFGVVKLGVHKKTGEKVAIKVISKKEMDNKDLELVSSELNIMKMARHKNVVRLLDHYENSNTIYIIMELLEGGTLNSFLENIEPTLLSEANAAKLIYQICEGILYLHSYGVVHRDLKPENVMLSDKLNDIGKAPDSIIKIMDFGLSKILGPNERVADGFGTLSFVAPEVLTRQPYGKGIDVWSIGVMLYYMVSGLLPFDDEEDSEEVIAKKIVFQELKFPSKYFKSRSKDLIDLLKKLLTKDQEKRVTIEQVIKHPWFTNV